MTSEPPPQQVSEDEIDDLLYLARAGETKEMVELLSDMAKRNGVDEASILVTAKDEYSNNNALHMAAGNGHLETTNRLLSFLPSPAGPDTQPHTVVCHKNASGNTPLHWAALNGHLEVVKALVITANADPTIINGAGHDAVYEAELNDKKDIVEWLLGHCDSLEGGIGGDAEENEGSGREAGEENPCAP